MNNLLKSGYKMGIKGLTSGIKKRVVYGILAFSLLGASLSGLSVLRNKKQSQAQQPTPIVQTANVQKEPKLYDYVIRHPGRDGYTIKDRNFYEFEGEKYFIEENDLGLTNDGKVFLAGEDALKYAQNQGKELYAVGIKDGKAEIIGSFKNKKRIDVSKAFDYIGLAVKKGKDGLERKLEILASVPGNIKDLYSNVKEKGKNYIGKTLSQGRKKETETPSTKPSTKDINKLETQERTKSKKPSWMNPGSDEINVKFYHRTSPLEKWKPVEKQPAAKESDAEIKKHSTKYNYPKKPVLENRSISNNRFGILHLTSLDNLLIQPEEGYEANLYAINYADKNGNTHKTNQYLLVLQNKETNDVDSVLLEVYLNTDAKRFKGYSILGLAETEDPFNITPQPLEGKVKTVSPEEWASFLKSLYPLQPGNFHDDGSVYAKEKGFEKYDENKKVKEVDVERVELQELNLKLGGLRKENQPSEDGKVSGYAVEFKYNPIKKPTIFEFERGGLHLLWLPHNYWMKLDHYKKIDVKGLELENFHPNVYAYKNLLIKVIANPEWELFKGFMQGILSILAFYNASYVPPSHGHPSVTPTQPATPGGYVQGNIGQ